MIVKIQTRDDNGKYRQCFPDEFATAAFDKILRFSCRDGWAWMRDRLAAWCLLQAERNAANGPVADIWIDRYRALRDIR